MKFRKTPSGRHALSLTVALLGSTLLVGCFDSDNDSSSGSSQTEMDPNLFPSDGQLEATIRRTTGGVPHIVADDLKSAAFGHGYAQAQDNVCMLAEAIVKARSERAKYFGPGPDRGGLGLNVINDFSYKAQKIYSGAEQEFPALSAESRALIEGFTAGYNNYVGETAPADLPSQCRDAEWVKAISPVDLLAHYRVVGQYASGNEFATGVVFLAVPPNTSPVPRVVSASPTIAKADLESLQRKIVETAQINASNLGNVNDTGLASNAWGIGKELTAQGRGALLANPHFPYTGHRRLYEVQMTVPGYMNMHGAGLLGTAIPLINFNENLAWSHTVTTSRRFTWYELALSPTDNLSYVKDGVEKPITVETYQIEVDMGDPAGPITMEREFYFSEYGPMVAANIANGALPSWGGNGAVNGVPAAYTYRDANANTGGLLDTWLGMSRASNLAEFQSVFKNCGSTLWTNSTYADDQGNAFYIDSSSVPNLSEKTIALVNFKRTASPDYALLFDNGVTLLDGSSSSDDWVEGDCNGLVPYEDKPKLLRTDWVQNSNSSHWATNPNEFLEGYSPLFGAEKSPLNPRTRLGIKMLQNPLAEGVPGAPAPAGQDGKFNAEELLGVIWNNRAWHAEQFLPELLERCETIGATPVAGEDLSAWCDSLASWDSLYNLDSVGAHVFRVFMANYIDDLDDDLTTRFAPADPVGTPANPSKTGAGTPDDTMLLALASGVSALSAQGIGPDAKLRTVQYYRTSGGVAPGNSNPPEFLGDRIPWHGGDGNIDGAFNAVGVVTDPFLEDTRFPRIAPKTVDNTAGLSDGTVGGINGWLMARGTSWHFGLEFTDNGPEAYGLVSYSQSTDPDSPYFEDQSEMYSMKMSRKLPFTEDEIAANLIANGEITVSTPE